MLEPPTRHVTVVLCTRDGRVLGALPSIELSWPWWTGVTDIVDAVRERHGLDITVLRLLDTDRPPTEGGAHVVHLAEVAGSGALPPGATPGPVPVLPADALADNAWRQPYARPGGPAADLAWAAGVLRSHGLTRTDRPQQMRTWNLSSIWQLPTSEGSAWLKVVPPFFAHEGAMLELAAQVSEAVPPLLGHEPGRVLLRAVDGDDLYHAAVDDQVDMVRLLVGIQAALVGRSAEILATGAFDWRPAALLPLVHDVVERTTREFDAETRSALDLLLSGLPRRFSAVAECGIPDTLVHGDFHPGNVRGDGRRHVLMDWGDSGLGNPLLDQAAFLEWVRPPDRERVRQVWAQEWRSVVPGSDPERASALLEPVAALRQAVIYRIFLDRIEPRERIYHAADPPMWLRQAARAAGTAG